MATTMSGALVFQENRTESDVRYDFIGKNSEVFAVGDLVQVTSGRVLVGTIGCVGIIDKTVTMSSTNQTVAKVIPGFIPLNTQTVLLMGTNSDLTDNATDGGKYFMVTGATGAQKVNVSGGQATGASRSVIIVKVDPRGLGGTGAGSGVREVLVRYVNLPQENVNITA